MFKKILKFVLYGLGIIVLILVGFFIWFRPSIGVITGNKIQSDSVASVPQVEVKEYPAITMGKADWTNWLGKDGNNSNTITEFPIDWSKSSTKLWEVNYLCQGSSSSVWSAPVIQGNRLIVCGRSESDDLVFCLNPDTGDLIWKGAYAAEADNKYGTGMRATPWIDGDYVYTYGRSGDVVCWALLDGEKVWHKNVKSEGGKEPTWGYSSSPYVTETLVVVNAGGSARTIAYDKRNGDVKWKCGTGAAGYAAITVMKIGQQDVVLDFFGKGLAAVDIETGKELWSVPWITKYDVNATSPQVSGEHVFITSDYGKGCELLKVSAEGADVVWKNKNIASHHSDPFIINGNIYGYTGMSMQNKGDFKCLDFETGQENWSTGQMGWGTAIIVNDHLLCMDIKGNVYLMKPSPLNFKLVGVMYEVLGKVKGAAWTKPIVANDKLYLRFKQKLICFEL